MELDCSETRKKYDTFVANMQRTFTVEDRGNCDHILGYKIDYDKERGILKLTQTPCSPNIKPHISWCPDPTTPEEIKWMKEQDYPNRVGAGLWLARGSKPEISWTVGMMSRFLTNPSRKHWEMSEHPC